MPEAEERTHEQESGRATVAVETATAVTPALLQAVARLIPQLSSSAPPPDAEDLGELVASPGSTLFLARDDRGEIVGMLALVTYRIPTGLRAVIEDVVVDDTSRGTGAGSALVQAAVNVARDRGAKSVDLTSRPSREDANRLYVRLGFEQRATNMYRHYLA